MCALEGKAKSLLLLFHFSAITSTVPTLLPVVQEKIQGSNCLHAADARVQTRLLWLQVPEPSTLAFPH